MTKYIDLPAARAFLDDDDKPITPKQAKKEGYKNA